MSLSSNNQQYFKTRKGFVICKNGLGNYVTQANGIDMNLAEKCMNSSFYVPKTVEDMQKAIENITVDHFEQPVRILTDYKMVNETHFWSDTGQNWWSKVKYQENLAETKGRKDSEWLTFKNLVMFDGNKKLQNYGPPMDAACICVCNQKLKWELKCLILFLVASFVFTSIALSTRRCLNRLNIPRSRQANSQNQ